MSSVVGQVRFTFDTPAEYNATLNGVNQPGVTMLFCDPVEMIIEVDLDIWTSA